MEYSRRNTFATVTWLCFAGAPLCLPGQGSLVMCHECPAGIHVWCACQCTTAPHCMLDTLIRPDSTPCYPLLNLNPVLNSNTAAGYWLGTGLIGILEAADVLEPSAKGTAAAVS